MKPTLLMPRERDALHMRLHARQIALAAGADPAEVAAVAEVIVAEHNVKEGRAREVLAALRAGATA